jgi:hypothetical protein
VSVTGFGVLVDLEEIGGAQVIVALFGARVDRRGFDGHRDRGLRGVVGDREGTLELSEAAFDLGDHQVLGLELDRRVRRIDGPGPRRRELHALPLSRRYAGHRHGGPPWRYDFICNDFYSLLPASATCKPLRAQVHLPRNTAFRFRRFSGMMQP